MKLAGLSKTTLFNNWLAFFTAVFICLPPVFSTANSAKTPNIMVLEAYPITKGHTTNTEIFMAKIRKTLSEAGLSDARITFYPWNRGLDLLNTAKNTIVFPIDKAGERNNKLQWIAPLIKVNLVMLSKNLDIKSVYDAVEFDRVLVRHNSNYEHILRQFGFSNIVPVTSETMHQMLSQNRAQAWFTSDIEARQLTSLDRSISVSDTLGIQKMWIAATLDVEKEHLQKIRSAIGDSNEFAQIATPQVRQLNIASVDNVDMQILKELSFLYLEQNPDLKINWNLMPENHLREKITTDILSSAQEFDLITIGPFELAGWGRQGWLRPFNVLPSNYDTSDIFGHLNQSLRFKGKLLALPFYSETLLTYYRKDLLAKAHISMPSTPTYLQLAEIAAAIHNPDEGVFGICLRGLPGWGQNMSVVTSMIGSFGGSWFDDDWHPQATSPQWQKAIKYYINLILKYGPPNSTQLGHAEIIKLFSDGKCGIWLDASVFSSQLTDPKRSKVHDRVGITVAPHQVTNYAHWMWYWSLAIPKNALHHKEAQKFALWATSKEYISAVARRYGWRAAPPGTRRSTYNKDYQREAPYSDIIKQTLEKTGAYPILATPQPSAKYQFIDIPEFQLIASYAGKIIGQMLDKEIAIDKGLTLIQKKTTEIMTKAGYIKNNGNFQ